MAIIDEQNIFESNVPVSPVTKAKIDSSFPKYRQRQKQGAFADVYSSAAHYDGINVSNTELKILGSVIVGGPAEGEAALRELQQGTISINSMEKMMFKISDLQSPNYAYENKISQMKQDEGKTQQFNNFRYQ